MKSLHPTLLAVAAMDNGLPVSAQLTLGSLGVLGIVDSLFTLGVND